MYTSLLISIAVFSAAFFVYWRATQATIRSLRETVDKQERMLKKNLPEVREEYARVFSRMQKRDERTAREILGL